MTAFVFNAGEMERQLAEAVNRALSNSEVLAAVNGAMASRLHDIVLKNIGDTGIDRPNAWAPLSKRYAKRVKRSHATLRVSGDLIRSIRSAADWSHGEVWQDDSSVEYGPAHQFGEGHMPLRPFFPIVGDGLTEFAEAQLTEAAQTALDDAMQSSYDRD